jgi:hypothetical protein
MEHLSMLNATTNARNLILFLFVVVNAYSNSPDSVPIAEYCVGYGKKIYYNDDGDCSCDTAYVHLHIKKKLREQLEIATCITYSSSHSEDEALVNRFLIDDDLKAEKSIFFTLGNLNKTWVSVSNGASAYSTESRYASGVYWHFAEEVPIYAKNGKQVDFNKYYEKGKIIPVEWELKASCGSFYDVVYSGSYFIRITGECE